MLFIFYAAFAGAEILRKENSRRSDPVDPVTALCDAKEIQPLCAALTTQESASQSGEWPSQLAEDISDLLAAPQADVAAFLAAAGVRNGATCVELCKKTVRFAQQQGFSLPPKTHVACLDETCSKQIDVSPQAAATLAQHDLSLSGVLAYGPGAGTQFERSQRGDYDVSAFFGAEADVEVPASPGVYPQPPDDYRVHFHQAPVDEDDERESEVPMSPTDAARTLALLFGVHVYEAPGASMLEVDETGAAKPKFGPKVKTERYEVWHEYAAKGQSLVATALNNIDSRGDLMERWFAVNSYATRRTVKGMLNKALQTMLKLKIKVAEECGPSTLAYVSVWRDVDKNFIRSERDEEDTYVVNVCEYFWESAKRLSYRYGTLIHEATHHHGPTDVVFAPEPNAVPSRYSLNQGTSVLLVDLSDQFRFAHGARKPINGEVAKVESVSADGRTVNVKLDFFQPSLTGDIEDLHLPVPIDNVRLGATAYGIGMCKKLVELQPTQATQNADNFMWATIELASEAVRAPGEWPCDIYAEPEKGSSDTLKVEVYCTEDIRGGKLRFRFANGREAEIGYEGLSIEAHQPFTVPGFPRELTRGQGTADIDSGTFVFTATHKGQTQEIFSVPLKPYSPCSLELAQESTEVHVTVACSSSAQGLLLSAKTPEGETADFRQLSAAFADRTHLPLPGPGTYRFPGEPYLYFGFDLSVEDAGRRYTVGKSALKQWSSSSLCMIDVGPCSVGRGQYCVRTTAVCRNKVENMELRYESNSQHRRVEIPLAQGSPYVTAVTESDNYYLSGRPASVSGYMGGRKLLLWEGYVARY